MKNKDNSRKKLLNAVGTVLKDLGFKSLKAEIIAKTAGVDKKLITIYFGSVDNLIETYILEYDYWTNTVRKVNDAIIGDTEFNIENLLNFYLEKEFEILLEDRIQQQIILWGISEKNDIITKIINNRERVGESIFNLLEERFPDAVFNYRAVYALMVSGIYQLTLHSQVNEGTFCGLNINNLTDRTQIVEALKLINHLIIQQLAPKTVI